jgi:hypothetical protein
MSGTGYSGNRTFGRTSPSSSRDDAPMHTGRRSPGASGASPGGSGVGSTSVHLNRRPSPDLGDEDLSSP